jgi:hypothetical protein
MKTQSPTLTLAIFIVWLATACTTTGEYQSMQDKLQQQMETISVLDQRVDAAKNTAERKQILAQLKQAVRGGIVLLKQLQQRKTDGTRSCLDFEYDLPSDIGTCYKEEGLEETRMKLMVVLMGQMVKPFSAP